MGQWLGCVRVVTVHVQLMLAPHSPAPSGGHAQAGMVLAVQAAVRSSTRSLRTFGCELWYLGTVCGNVGGMEWNRKGGLAMDDGDVVLTQMRRAVVDGLGATRTPQLVTIVAGAPERRQGTRLTLTQAQQLPGPGGSSRYRHVYKLSLTEPLTSPSSTRRSWHGDTLVPPMGASGIRRLSYQGPSMPG